MPDLRNYAAQVREEAARLGVEPAQLAHAAVADLIAAEGPDFDSAAQRVLEKNRELYRQQARGARRNQDCSRF